jgi:GntR family transcriptional regulator
MEFVFQENSPLTAHTQIKEQIKVALMLGNLRPGEILPSIRDLEKDLGISRSIVRKAYLELEEHGILKLIQGKGVMVNKNLRYREDRQFLDNCEKLVQVTRRSCLAKGFVFSSFAKYLYQKAIEFDKESPPLIYIDVDQAVAEERAAEVSHILEVLVVGMAVDRLKISKSSLAPGTKVLCNYYRLDIVTKALRGRKGGIVPLRMLLGEDTKRILRGLPRRSKVMYLFDPRDTSALSLVLEDYKRAYPESELEFVPRPAKDIARQIRSEDYGHFIISNRLWNSQPKEIRKTDRVTHPSMVFDLSSIEEAKMQLGIIA